MPSVNEKKILLAEGTGEITEKKSRFIAHCKGVSSEDEARLFIDAIKKQYWDARHNCFAYVIGRNSEIQRFSDDGEPQGTAGKPILECLLSNNITNTVIVITRYFGGILLGAGGLVRAYTKSAMEGLNNSAVSYIYEGQIITVTCDYSFTGKLQNIFSNLSEEGMLLITDTLYSDNVSFSVCSEEKTAGKLMKNITEATSGQAEIKKEKTVSFAVKDGSPVYLNF